MAIVIAHPQTEHHIERLASRLGLSPAEAVQIAVTEKAARMNDAVVIDEETVERRRRAMCEAQAWFKKHGNHDSRTADEIIGYNEHGHFD